MLKKYADLLVVAGGSLIVTAWTLFRFFTQGVNFDMTGQQLLARQWLEGYTDGSTTAPTNYIIKMLGIYMPAELLGINPQTTLVVSTIAVNVLTFAGLYFLLKKLLQYFKVPVNGFFYGAMLWLATVAGSVFWIQFTNSRNLELVAGLLVLYLGLLFYKKPTFKLGAWLTVAAGITFFADPLQMYMVPTTLLIFAGIESFVLKKSKKTLAVLAGLLLGGWVLASGLVFATQQLAHISFFAVSSLEQTLRVVQFPVETLMQTVKNTVRLLAGTNEMGLWRQVVNIGLVGLLAGALAWAAFKKRIARRPLLFAVVWLVVTLGIYVASGHPSFQTDTSRYLIMLAPALVFAFSLLAGLGPKVQRGLVVILFAAVAINVVSLFWFTAKNWSPRVLNDASLHTRFTYLKNSGYAYGYASLDTAIPGGYLFGKNQPAFLPLACESGTLRRNTLFFDKAVFKTNQAKSAARVPFLLDGDHIHTPNVCTTSNIVAQLGPPEKQEILPSGELVLIYDAQKIVPLLK